MTKYIGPDKGYALESSKNTTHKSMSKALMEKKRYLIGQSFIAEKYKRRKPSYERVYTNATHICFEYTNHTNCNKNYGCRIYSRHNSSTPKPGFSSGHKSPKHLKHRWNSSKNLSRPEVGSYSNDLYIGGGIIILLSIFIGILYLFYKKRSKSVKAKSKSKEPEDKTGSSTSESIEKAVEQAEELPLPEVGDTLKAHAALESSLPVAQQLRWDDKIHLLLEKILPAILYSPTHKQTMSMKNTVIEV